MSSRPVQVCEILFQNQKETPKRGMEKKGGKIDSPDIAILVVTIILYAKSITCGENAIFESSPMSVLVFQGLGRGLCNFFSVD